MAHSQIKVVLNRRSGTILEMGPEQLQEQLRTALERTGLPVEIFLLQGCEIATYVRTHSRIPGTFLIIGGGDGTITSAIRALGSECEAVGLLPLGTMNLFVTDLGIPADLDEAIETLVQGEVREVDLAEVNGRTFTTNTHIGLYPRVGREREGRRGQPKWKKWPQLVIEGLRILTRYPLMTVRLTTAEGEQRRYSTRLITVSNNIYDHAAVGELPSRTHLDRGELGVYVLNYQGRLRLLLGFATLLTGRWQDNPNITLVRTSEVEIDTPSKRRRNVMIDGEILQMPMPLRFKSLPRQLKVIAPRTMAQKETRKLA